jgi:hypothetical protein
MFRVLSFVLVLVATSWAAPVIAAEYESKELADAGTQYRQDLLDKVAPNKRQPALIARLRKDADGEYKT